MKEFLGEFKIDENEKIIGNFKLSEGECNLDGDVNVLFEGSVFNLSDLTEKSNAKHYVDMGDIIASYYIRNGIEKLVRALNGKFAIAIHDKCKNTAFLIRDHIGIEPLYYYQNNDSVTFSNKVKDFIRSGITSKISYEGLLSYLIYESVQEPYTILSNVYSLSPGSYLSISHRGFIIRRYWDPINSFSTFYERQDTNDAFDVASKKSKELVFDAVKRQYPNESTNGLFLSGGIDSSSLVAIVRQMYPDNKINTFSVIHDNPKYDERKYSKFVAEINNTNHIELLLKESFMKNYISNLISDFDQPSLDGMNTWYTCKLVKELGYDTAISGIGGDELFVGGDFEPFYRVKRYHDIFKYLPNGIGHIIDKLFGNRHLKRLAEVIECQRDPYFVCRRIVSNQEVKQILNAQIYKNHISEFMTWEGKSFDIVNWNAGCLADYTSKLQYFEEATYLVSTELRDTVQMSKVNGVDIHFPLLDYRIVEYMTTLPVSSKSNGKIPKVHLVNMAGKGLPKECWDRTKMGFGLPYEDFIRGVLKEEWEKLYVYGSDESWYNKKTLKKMWMNFLSGKESWEMIWSIYILNKWIKDNNVTF